MTTTLDLQRSAKSGIISDKVAGHTAVLKAFHKLYKAYIDGLANRESGTYRLMLKLDRGRVMDVQTDASEKCHIDKFVTGKS